MKKQLDPTVAGIVIVIVGVIAVGFVVMRAKGPGFQEQKAGSEESMGKVKQGGTLYQPPANAPIPGKGGSMPNMGR